MIISDKDTIAAISSAVVNSGISIIRVSGDDSFVIVDKIFKGKQKIQDMNSHTVAYGKIHLLENNETVDEVLLLKMEAPKTYTKENTVEINCHGGLNVTNRVFMQVIKAGARVAEPGEFTKRAFLNGRIDLSQAEAVMDLINSNTEIGGKVAISHLEGKYSKYINGIRNELIDISAEIEFNIEFNEDDISDDTMQRVIKKLSDCENAIRSTLDTYDTGKIYRDGIQIAISGRPNVGKSSLLNEITGNERAIVTNIPGTTRDVIEEYVNINGIAANISDCAGIRKTEDVIEKIGIEKSYKAAEKADIVLYVLDALNELTQEDFDFLEKYDNKQIILIVNKTDLLTANYIKQKGEVIKDQIGIDPVFISLKEHKGIDQLYDKIREMLNIGKIETHIVTNVRHKRCLEMAEENVKEAITALKEKIPVDLVTIDLKQAIYNIGSITGETASDDIIERIFSNFCVGK